MDIVTIGEVLIDLTQTGRDERGIPQFAANPGGAPANLAVAAARLGAQTTFIGKVGEDAFGRYLTKVLQENKVDTRYMVTDADHPTTMAVVSVDAAGERDFSFYRSANADVMLRKEDILEEPLKAAKIVHFGSVSLTADPARTATLDAAARAKKLGAIITYDPNYRPPLWKTEQEAKEQILWGLRQADLVKISDEEVQFLWGCSPEQGAERVLALGAKLVMVTLGPKGCFLKNAQAEYRCGCPQVRTVDTTGAGDIFGGSAVSRFLELGKTPEQLTQEDLAYMARYASAAASLSTEKSGAIPSIPAKGAVLQKMQEAY